MDNQCMKAMDFRHACKVFDEKKKISEEDMRFILEVGRKSPSSFGLESDENIYAWTSKQSYIAAANMMTSAAFIGIDSCPIEGYEKDKVEQILQLDTTKFQLSLVLPFGYRAQPQPTQIRLPFEDVVEFIR